MGWREFLFGSVERNALEDTDPNWGARVEAGKDIKTSQFAKNLSDDLLETGLLLIEQANIMVKYADMFEAQGDNGPHAPPLRDLMGAMKVAATSALLKSSEWRTYAYNREDAEAREAK